MSSASPPPPYPGYPAGGNPGQPTPPYPGNSGGVPNQFIPPNVPYNAPYPPTDKPSQGFPTAPGYQQGYPAPQPYPPGYSQPGQPVGMYAQPYSTSANYTHGTTVVVAQPAITVIQTFRDMPVHTNCPHCRAEIMTGTHYEVGTFTWVICCIMWLLGCGMGCCLIPFCVDSCKDVIHTCPNCQQQIARYSRI
ncbi:lipopolysaccharide-induced tumor necrosis factor-alpha factor homolog isoform X2 [Physella acuta]|uniref:lipopolysaccharide-induced tumor necrosis factor-alpha factor homolog isoform X2 n=1 Tax=Physella acuta TaxID=109671 RepID=UPI0027DC7A06|nr:lipopolysaccharide-induced tumor necrosis factor-alpha factor homolog isoform X2 [Physella acuta]